MTYVYGPSGLPIWFDDRFPKEVTYGVPIMETHMIPFDVELSDESLDNIGIEDESEYEYLECPECGEPIAELWSGVKCFACDWWECY